MANKQEVKFENDIAIKVFVKRRGVDTPEIMRFDESIKPAVQQLTCPLMPLRSRRTHKYLSVEKLVSAAIVRRLQEVLYVLTRDAVETMCVLHAPSKHEAPVPVGQSLAAQHQCACEPITIPSGVRRRQNMESINWRTYIHSDPEVMVGKPVIRGTRLTVEFVLRLFAAGWTRAEIFENYPSLTEEAIRAVFAFARGNGALNTPS